MKYFTPEFYLRGQSRDHAVLAEVEQEWDQAGDRYVAYLRTIEDRIPRGIRFLHDNYHLHDALVLSMGRQGDTFVVVLRLEWPPLDMQSELVLFTYDLTGEPVIDREALPPEHRCETEVEWMYDEVELVEGERPTFLHSILLGNGWEVRLPFRDVRAQQFRPLIPAPRNGPGGATPAEGLDVRQVGALVNENLREQNAAGPLLEGYRGPRS